MTNVFNVLLDKVQRQSFIISITAFFTSLLLIALVSILVLISFRGAAYFWPEPIYLVNYLTENDESEEQLLAQLHVTDEAKRLYHLKYSDALHPLGNEKVVHSRQIINHVISKESAEVHLNNGAVVLGIPKRLITPAGQDVAISEYDNIERKVAQISHQIDDIRKNYLANIHESIAELDRKTVDLDAPARQKLLTTYTQWQRSVEDLEQARDEYQLQVAFSSSDVYLIKISDVRAIDYVGQLSVMEKWKVAFNRLMIFLSDTPKQANTAGGVFPALFGTVLMVFLMTIIVTPFGVLAAIYLSEYAPDTMFTTAIRISVSNMAGVPSIVYGVFGLGFFVYTLGGNIDALFFSHRLPAPTMGTPGVFWASLTMAILTLPVVIVATEEGLRRVPEGLKAGSYALGATKAETIMKTILPIASPGIMTGVILAIARAAGEVAPLMMVGAVKFAPNLPIDGEFPYLHLDRQFMHLGVLIYDGAFHSYTDAKNSSMMFAACLLLLAVVFVLNILAVILRTRLRKRYLQG